MTNIAVEDPEGVQGGKGVRCPLWPSVKFFCTSSSSINVLRLQAKCPYCLCDRTLQSKISSVIMLYVCGQMHGNKTDPRQAHTHRRGLQGVQMNPLLN